MVKHTQTTVRQQPADFFGVFDHFVRLVLKGFGSYQAFMIEHFYENSSLKGLLNIYAKELHQRYFKES